MSATAVKLLDRLVKERSKELVSKLRWHERQEDKRQARILQMIVDRKSVDAEVMRLWRQVGDLEVALKEHQVAYFANVERQRIVDAYNRVVDERDALKEECDRREAERRMMQQELVLLRMDAGVKT